MSLLPTSVMEARLRAVSTSDQASAMLRAEFNRIAYQNGRSGTDVSVAKWNGWALTTAVPRNYPPAAD